MQSKNRSCQPQRIVQQVGFGERKKMSQSIPENLRASQALKLVVEQGWNWKDEGILKGQIQVETCPFCSKGDFKFYIAVCDPKDSNRDGDRKSTRLNSSH